jgi:hypothetical protein
MSYPKAQNGDWIYPRMGKRGGFFAKCCDCALVHRFDFEITQDGRGRNVLRFKAYRDQRKTAAGRRDIIKRIEAAPR